MQLSVDVLEVTRLPFSKLETLYFSLSLGIAPKGKRITSNICFAKPSLCFKPRNFSLFIQNHQKANLAVTLNSYRANGKSYPISFISIPLASMPRRKVVAVNFAMKSLIGTVNSPILRLELFLSRDPDEKPDRNDPGFFEPEIFGDLAPLIVRGHDIDYTEYEMPFQCVRGKTGQVSPPQHISEHWLKLFQNSETRQILKDLFLDDVLREQVVKNLRKFYESSDFINISDLTDEDGIRVKSRDACAKEIRNTTPATNYESSTALEFETPLVKSKSKKIAIDHHQKTYFHFRTKSQGECDSFAPSPPTTDDDSLNPRRANHDQTEAEIRSKGDGHSNRSRKSQDDALPDIPRTSQPRQTAPPSHGKGQISKQQSLTEIEGVKMGLRGISVPGKQRQEFHESPPKQLLLRGFPPPKFQQTSPEIEISKPMLRGMPPPAKKQADLHEKGPVRGLLQQRVPPGDGNGYRRESPPQKHPFGDSPQAPKSLMRGLPNFPQKTKGDDADCEVKPPLGAGVPVSPFSTRPKHHGQSTENGTSPRRTRSNTDG